MMGFILGGAVLGTPLRGVAVANEPTGLNALEPHFRQSVLRGWRAFQTPHAEDGVACVHCHPDHEQIRRWAPAYPKVEVFDGTPYRVKTLGRVIREAVDRHTDLEPTDRESLVDDLAAYIAWWGDGLEVAPGRSRTLPPAESDLRLLRESVARGMVMIRNGPEGHCLKCHKLAAESAVPLLEEVAAQFPKFVPSAEKVMSLSSFLAYHLEDQEKGRKSLDSEAVTDIAACLAHLAEGRTYLPGHLHRQK